MFRFVRLLSLLLLAGSLVLLASAVQAQTICPSVAASPTSPDVVAWHYDNCRTGWQKNETILTATGSGAVSPNNFGLVAQWNGLPPQQPLGHVYAEPLAVSGLPTVQVSGGPTCNNPCSLVLIADESDMLWAYNAGSNSQTPVWNMNLAAAVGGIGPVDCQTITVFFGPCENGVLGNSVGATGTGVVDESNPQDPILYLAAVVDLAGLSVPTYYLYAVDIVHATLEATPISGSVTGKNPSDQQQDNICTSDYPANGPLQFNYNHIQRAGLLFVGGNVYIPFSPGDGEWENGWLFGYKYDVQHNTFTQTAVYSTTPYGTGGGIWGSGAGPASDTINIYTVTGNGTWDLWGVNPSSADAGDSVLKLLPNGNGGMSIMDYYTPSDVLTYVPPGGRMVGRCTPPNDLDLGSGGLMIFPDQFYTPPGQQQALSLSVVADKESNLYVMNINNLGKFTPNGGGNCGNNNCGSNVETITTPSVLTPDQGYWGSGAYWKQTSGGTTNYFLYYTATSHFATAAPYPIYQYTLQTSGSSGPITNSASVASHSAQGPVLFCVYSPTPSVSSNGSSAGGILWAIENSNPNNPSPGNCAGIPSGPAVLHAFDAGTMNQLYTSSGITNHKPGHATYPTPTIFNGRVYMGTSSEVDVFGLCGAPNPPCLN
jgi:hypothetical protein